MQAYSPAYKTNNHISQQYIDNYNITAITSLKKYKFQEAIISKK
jgi:hypothetical protein